MDFNPLPLRERETSRGGRPTRLVIISIHSPCARGRQTSSMSLATCSLFQSTPPARGGDRTVHSRKPEQMHFNPLPLREGETHNAPTFPAGEYISIHSPCARGRRHSQICRHSQQDISIHSPCARGRHYVQTLDAKIIDFNPLPLREGETANIPKKGDRLIIFTIQLPQSAVNHPVLLSLERPLFHPACGVFPVRRARAFSVCLPFAPAAQGETILPQKKSRALTAQPSSLSFAQPPSHFSPGKGKGRA